MQQYIQIKTVHPNPDYKTAIEFLSCVAAKHGLNYWTVDLVGEKQALLISYQYQADRPSILFNSHMDVVPVSRDDWEMDPFSGLIMDGKMYGRGTQDMKVVGIQGLVALIRLAESNAELSMNIVLSFVPDEEILGLEGMGVLADKLENIAFAFDEGIPSQDSTLNLFHAERKVWWIKLTSTGETGHGSKYVDDSSTHKLHDAASNLMAFAKQQQELTCDLVDKTTVNMNYCNWGNSFMYNVIPTTCEAGFDIRIPTSTNLEEFEQTLKQWTIGTNLEFIHGTDKNHLINPVTDPDNEFCQMLTSILQKEGIEYQFQTFPATTDARYLRNQNIPVIGMSLLFNTENLLHDHNEYVKLEDITRGVDLYHKIMVQFSK